MQNLYGARSLPAELRHAGVFIFSVDPTQRHLGLISKSDSGEIEWLHLAWHYFLSQSSPEKEFLWIDPSIATIRLRQVAAQCRKIARENALGGIPYAFDLPNECFDADSMRFLAATKHGLTCATFVLAVFETVGLSLIDSETWPEREDDIDWKSTIIEKLKGRAETSHIQNIESQLHFARFRPEEVAASATIAPGPSDFSSVSPIAEEILKSLAAIDTDN